MFAELVFIFWVLYGLFVWGVGRSVGRLFDNKKHAQWATIAVWILGALWPLWGYGRRLFI
jgi:hypothetical protein